MSDPVVPSVLTSRGQNRRDIHRNSAIQREAHHSLDGDYIAIGEQSNLPQDMSSVLSVMSLQLAKLKDSTITPRVRFIKRYLYGDLQQIFDALSNMINVHHEAALFRSWVAHPGRSIRDHHNAVQWRKAAEDVFTTAIKVLLTAAHTLPLRATDLFEDANRVANMQEIGAAYLQINANYAGFFSAAGAGLAQIIGARLPDNRPKTVQRWNILSGLLAIFAAFIGVLAQWMGFNPSMAGYIPSNLHTTREMSSLIIQEIDDLIEVIYSLAMRLSKSREDLPLVRVRSMDEWNGVANYLDENVDHCYRLASTLRGNFCEIATSRHRYRLSIVAIRSERWHSKDALRRAQMAASPTTSSSRAAINPLLTVIGRWSW